MLRTKMLTHLSKAVEEICPLKLAETAWDNVGLLVEAPFPRKDARSVYVCIDITQSVVKEVLADPEAGAILSYHPPIFKGLKSFTTAVPLQKSLLECVASGVSVFTVHTAADNCVGGVNDFLLATLQAHLGSKGTIVPVRKFDDSVQVGAGSGRILTLAQPVSLDAVVEGVKKTTGLTHVQLARSQTGASDIRTVAVCAGSGSEVLRGVDADVYLTGELSHHDVLYTVATGKHAILTHHSNSERPWLAHFAPLLQSKMNAQTEDKRYKVVASKEDSDPLVIV